MPVKTIPAVAALTRQRLSATYVLHIELFLRKHREFESDRWHFRLQILIEMDGRRFREA
jgi:hypothetical protein